MLLIQLSMTQHLQELQSKYDSRKNSIILTRRLCVCFTCCLHLCIFLLSFDSNHSNFNTVDSLIFKISWVLMSSKKTIHCWSLVYVLWSPDQNTVFDLNLAIYSRTLFREVQIVTPVQFGMRFYQIFSGKLISTRGNIN